MQPRPSNHLQLKTEEPSSIPTSFRLTTAPTIEPSSIPIQLPPLSLFNAHSSPYSGALPHPTAAPTVPMVKHLEYEHRNSLKVIQ